jgi:PAS domain-containing protein
MFRQVCFYCNAYLGSVAVSGNHAEQISHGICPDCFPKFVAGTGEQFEDFLNSLPAPVFVVDQAGTMVTANTRGLELIPADLQDVVGRFGGEVFSCKYASLPDGCGETIHCKTCTIRNTVTSTFESGEPAFRVPAYMDLGDLTGIKSIRFIISTEKVGNFVLLRIDDARHVNVNDVEARC